jgi:hypothetical protein
MIINDPKTDLSLMNSEGMKVRQLLVLESLLQQRPNE